MGKKENELENARKQLQKFIQFNPKMKAFCAEVDKITKGSTDKSQVILNILDGPISPKESEALLFMYKVAKCWEQANS